MKVMVFPLDTWGCGHYRMYWPTLAVAEQELIPVQIVPPDKRVVTIRFGSGGEVLDEHFPVGEGDVIVFQRPAQTFMPDVIRLLQKRGVRVVIDMDDDLAAIHPRNPAWLGFHPTLYPNGHSWLCAQESCRIADMVIVTTPQLARRYGSHGRCAVIPNMVPADYLDLPHIDNDHVGWGGSVQTHPDDLQTVGGSIAALVREGYTFRTVGDVRAVAEVLRLPRDPMSTGPVDFDRYAASIAQFGIGIAPLAKSKFNEAKSRLKPLEYAAVGVPWVGSRTEDYELLHREGCGIIVDKPKHWESTLRRLIRDPGRRKALSDAGREVAARNTFEKNAWRWAEAWQAAADG